MYTTNSIYLNNMQKSLIKILSFLFFFYIFYIVISIHLLKEPFNNHDPEEFLGYNITIQSYHPLYKATVGKLTKINNNYYMNNINAVINNAIITAINGELSKDKNILHLSQLAKIFYSNYVVESQYFNIDLTQNILTSEGKINITSPNLLITAKELMLDLDIKNFTLKGNVQTSIKFNRAI